MHSVTAEVVMIRSGWRFTLRVLPIVDVELIQFLV